MAGTLLGSRSITHGVVENAMVPGVALRRVAAAKLGKGQQEHIAEVRYIARFRARLLRNVTRYSYLGSP